nr:hypothetical protein 4 [Bacillaceae bacterium]
MDLKDYIITINDLKYCKDIIKDRLLLVENVEYVGVYPSIGQDNTLYILKNGVVVYYNNFEFSQVELEKQTVEKEKTSVKETKEVKKDLQK